MSKLKKHWACNITVKAPVRFSFCLYFVMEGQISRCKQVIEGCYVGSRCYQETLKALIARDVVNQLHEVIGFVGR